MNNNGISLKGPAMRSFVEATGTPTTMRASSISTTTGPTMRTTTSVSADPRNTRPDAGNASGGLTLGRAIPGAHAPKAWPQAKPETVARPAGVATECGSEFQRLTTLKNLHQCWFKASACKSSNLRVQRFAQDPLHYLTIIQQRLRTRSYTFGPYRTFTVIEKKWRDVVDAPMKDRVVHWMLYKYLLPIWQPRFIHDTYGNLPGRGTHAAVRRLADFCHSDRAVWALQLDLSKYFYSVPHAQLKAKALRYVGDQGIRNIITSLIDSWRTDDRYNNLFAPDSPYRTTPDKGMPIGNLSSQLFANIYLCEFDHWVKQELRVRHYIRYVDDMVIVGQDRDELLQLSSQIKARLESEGLTVHPHKQRLTRITAGVPFLGYVVWPNHISAGQYMRRRYHYRLRQHENTGRDLGDSLQSYRSMLAFTGSTKGKA